MAIPRTSVVDLEITPYYHVISRCVRRAFLCGFDPLSRRNFDHRKAWLVERLYRLVGLFAVDLCAYSIMSNHFHLVVRVDSDRAHMWSEEEVICRWCALFPGGRKRLLALSKRDRHRQIETWRKRLYSLSWFMRCLNESIARRANREDGCTGRFWEGRFRAQALADEGAVLTCMSYVDLNPIRAGVATSLENSHYTSVRDRLLLKDKAAKSPQTEKGLGEPTTASQRRDRLVPFADERSQRPHDNATLPFTRDEYLTLLRATAAAFTERAPALEGRATDILARFGLHGRGFLPVLQNFPRTFFTMVGQVHKIQIIGSKRGLKKVKGVGSARRLYLSAA